MKSEPISPSLSPYLFSESKWQQNPHATVIKSEVEPLFHLMSPHLSLEATSQQRHPENEMECSPTDCDEDSSISDTDLSDADTLIETIEESPHLRRYCICQRTLAKKNPPMERCANRECVYLRFHLSCVGLKSYQITEQDWICPPCTKAGFRMSISEGSESTEGFSPIDNTCPPFECHWSESCSFIQPQF